MIMPPDCKIPSKEVTGKHVIDGGALLHRVSWKKGSKFSAIATQYSNYVKRRYGTSAIVFDGYEEGMLSTKPNENLPRSSHKGSSRDVIIKRENESPYAHSRFLPQQMPAHSSP